MKIKLPVFLICFSPLLAFAQEPCASPSAYGQLSGNQISAYISNGGDLFNKDFEGQFLPIGETPAKSTMYSTGLWMAGYDTTGDLRLSVQTFEGLPGTYGIGPLDFEGQPYRGYCQQFDTMWSVERTQIEQHLSDLQDNGSVEAPIAAIYGWPGQGNPHFEQYNGFPWPTDTDASAPFFDENNDGIYDPDQGDYPHYDSTSASILAEQLVWTVFNDYEYAPNSFIKGVEAQIQLCSWTFQCDNIEVLNNTVFTSHTLTGRSPTPLDSFYISYWTQFSIGCFVDDAVGCSPERNAYFTYNLDDEDNLGSSSVFNCNNIALFGARPPAQSVTFLNQPMDKFMYYNSGNFNPQPGTEDPAIREEYYNYMTGSWRDGTPLTEGGSGYNNSSAQAASHAFPDDPNDPQGWSMYQNGVPAYYRRAVASHKIGRLEPGEQVRIDMAYTYHRRPGLSNLENVTQMYEDIDELHRLYANQFEELCERNVLSNSEAVPAEAYQISPNPAHHQVRIELKTLDIDELSIYDNTGKIIYNKSKLSGTQTIDLSAFPAGMYFITLQTQNKYSVEKLIVL